MPPLAFWQFGSAAMLLWAIAAAVPILIHLWSRHRYQQLPWGAMQFLLAAMRKNARRIQLTQWLLLALRTLILVLFALALANPLLSLVSPALGGGSGGRTLYVLVIDGSYSMDYRREGLPRLDEAKESARQLVGDGQQGDGYALILMGQPPRVVIGDPAFDPDDVSQELSSLEMPHAGANLPQTLAEIEATLASAREKHPRLVQRRVVFFTDLGRTTWQDVTTADVKQRLARLADLPGTSLALVDLGQPQEQNLAVTRLEMTQPLATLAAESVFQAEIQSFADQEMPRQSVELLIDGMRVAAQQVDVPPRGRANVSFPYRFDAAAEHVAQVRLADDRLPLDNQRWLSVPVREAIRVLCVYGRPGETRHIALALSPQRTDRPAVRVTEAGESTILESDLATYDCVVLGNIGRFSRDEAAVLTQYVRSGGGLIVFLGDQAQLDNYNQELGGEQAEERLLPARLLSLSEEAKYGFDPLEYRHPIVAPFRGFDKSGLLTTPIWKYVRMTPSEQATVALAFSGGDPALVEERIGRGVSLLFASAASPQSIDRTTDPPTPWSAFASWPSFPPLIQEVLLRAISGREEGRNVRVGDELVGTLPSGTSESAVQLSGPRGISQRLPLAVSGGESTWSFTGTSSSGIYEAHLDAAASGGQKFAVNIDPRESDLERVPADSLPEQIRLSLDASASGSSLTAAAPGSEYFRMILFAVLGLLACESLVAWWTGKGGA
ncbi:MAG TPA: BatA domain-containing protein [Pirellulaceae bacterium]|nr:BatA domain-containing protein [Pirellulaceae bacterium]